MLFYFLEHEEETSFTPGRATSSSSTTTTTTPMRSNRKVSIDLEEQTDLTTSAIDMTPSGNDEGLFSGRVSDIEIGRADGRLRHSSISHRISELSMGSGFDEDIPPFEYDKVSTILSVYFILSHCL